jgi:hypothetical protein
MKKKQKLLLNPKILQISCLRWMQREKKEKYRKMAEKFTEFLSPGHVRDGIIDNI